MGGAKTVDPSKYISKRDPSRDVAIAMMMQQAQQQQMANQAEMLKQYAGIPPQMQTYDPSAVSKRAAELGVQNILRQRELDRLSSPEAAAMRLAQSKEMEQLTSPETSQAYMREYMRTQGLPSQYETGLGDSTIGRAAMYDRALQAKKAYEDSLALQQQAYLQRTAEPIGGISPESSIAALQAADAQNLAAQEAYKQLEIALKDKATIKADELIKYLQQKKLEVKNSEALLPWQQVIAVSTAKQSQPPQVMAKEESGNTAVGQTPNLSAENQLQLQKYIQHLTLKAYSPSTIRTYTAEFSSLLQTIKSYPAEKLTADDIKRYLQKLLDSGIKENTIHSKLNALKFYYEQVLKKEKFFFDIPRPKKPLQIPKMFSKEDIEKILKATENLKHKTALLLCYSSGLRVSEVVALTVPAIDSKRMVINILAAKGKKDRIVPLSKTTLKYLQHYYKAYKPKHHFFEGQYEGEPWSSRSLQKVLDNAKRKVRINKPGS
ncbi:MAG: hypothetical protein EBX50_18615, partial [Chitinophagia bacterium]|nr:hypothetical protein [Chitinophagia bacterium]